jgi:hypothetical protein
MDKIIDFDLDIAKKILKGEMEGGFITREGGSAQIIHILDDGKFAGCTTDFPVYALIINDGEVEINSYTKDGLFYNDGDETSFDLFITFDKRRRGVKKGKSCGIFSTNVRLQKVLHSLMSLESPTCKIKGREKEGDKEISGIYKAAGTAFICLGDFDDIVEIDEITLEGEEK